MYRKNDCTISYKLVRSNRKTLSIQIDQSGNVIAKAPMRLPQSRIQEFVATKADWIRQKQEEIKQRETNHQEEKSLDIDMIAPNGFTYREWARNVITRRTRELAAVMNVTYGTISIRQQKTRWGSCSEKGNLNFNWRLVLMPEEAMDYVIIHELCHLKYMNHSREFWQYVERSMPEYRVWREWLKVY